VLTHTSVSKERKKEAAGKKDRGLGRKGAEMKKKSKKKKGIQSSAQPSPRGKKVKCCGNSRKGVTSGLIRNSKKRKIANVDGKKKDTNNELSQQIRENSTHKTKAGRGKKGKEHCRFRN